MRRLFFLSLLFFLLAVPLSLSFAEDKPELKLAQLPAQDASEAPPSGDEKEAKIVTAIEIKGNKLISTNTIISKMRTRIGSPYQENVISSDLKRLYLLGFFSDIKIDSEPYKDGLKIIVSVVERPIIDKIIFSGIRRITWKDEKIKGMLKSKEGQYLDYPSLSEDIGILKKTYEKMGYSQVEIDYKVDVNKDTGRAVVQFNVTENRRVKIKGISVGGNKAFGDNRIRRLMKTKPAWLFNAGVLKNEVLKEDIERIKAFYQQHGYADVVVDYQIQPLEKKPYLLNIIITIHEGKKYLVGDISISGNKDIKQKEILAALKEASPGRVFSQNALKQDVSNIQSLYFDRGYIMVNVRDTTSLNPKSGRIDIAYDITENEVAYVDKIKVRGNVKTKDIVVRRELRIRPGDRFDGEKLRRSKERLQNLGFFEEVSYDTNDTSTENKKDLVVEVKETKTGTFSFGGGYSTVDQFVGFVEIEQKNFDWKNFPYFTGAGQTLTVRGSFGTVSDNYTLSFTEPWMFDYPVSFGFDGYRRTHKKDSDVGYGYDEKVTGGDLRSTKEISEYVKAGVSYRYDIIDIGDISEGATDDLKREKGKNAISSMEFSLSFDDRDNVFDTTKGNLLVGSLENAGGPFGADKDYIKFSGRASHYFPLINRSSLEARLRVGAVDSYGDSKEVPIYERFFAGGAYSIRGYHERKVGPIDAVSKDPLGGESMWVGNLEYTYPVFSFLKAAAFYDIGNVWAKVDKIGFDNLKSGVGFGIRLKTPVGPIMLDYGIPLNKEPGEDKKGSGRFHFSMSQGF